MIIKYRRKTPVRRQRTPAKSFKTRKSEARKLTQKHSESLNIRPLESYRACKYFNRFATELYKYFGVNSESPEYWNEQAYMHAHRWLWRYNSEFGFTPILSLKDRQKVKTMIQWLMNKNGREKF